MSYILNAYLNRYNRLIRMHPFATAKLEKEDRFPRALLKIQVEPLSQDDYKLLVKQIGAVLAEQAGNPEEFIASDLKKSTEQFDRNWLLYESSIVPYTSLNPQVRQDRLVQKIAACFKPYTLEFKAMDFFKELVEQPHSEEELKNIADNYGKLITYFPSDNGYPLIEISILNNRINRLEGYLQ